MQVMAIFLLIGLNTSCTKTETPPPIVIFPTISLSQSVLVNEGTGNAANAGITVNLSKASTAEFSFKVTTSDGTAIAGQDYTAENGLVVTVQPGELFKTINITLVGDDIFEMDDSFTVSISDPVGATLGSVTSTKVTIINDDTYTPEIAADGPITPDNYPGMTLVWSDEFSDATINADNWTHEQGAGGWGNNELQNYTNMPGNSSVVDGKLNITATKPAPNFYRSARMISKGKKEFTYGRIDIRAKMPIGKGIWPALWMLGGNISSVSWPKCGEIDIMEYLGHDQVKIYGTAHYDKNGHQSKGGNYVLPNGGSYHEQFHVFSIVWQENSIRWYVDYHKYFEVSSTSIEFAAFNLPQFFIMNIAVGGNWPGNPDASTQFPQTMYVDYVRVFQ